MNAIYQRYLQDEQFRAGLVAAAKRERALAMARFFSRLFTLDYSGRKPAPRADFVRRDPGGVICRS